MVLSSIQTKRKDSAGILRRVSLAISFIAIAFLLGWGAGSAHATPSTEFWTAATMDIQPYKVWHLGIDNYFPLNGPGPGENSGFATDVGLTVGVLPFTKVNMEVGVDMLQPIDSGVCAGALNHGATITQCGTLGDAFLFNAKIGTPEASLFDWSPGIAVGIFNVGFQPQVTNMDIADLIVGKTIGALGRIHVGAYWGNAGSALMHQGGDLANGNENYGWMVAYDRGMLPIKDAAGNEYNRLVIAADYASGKNFIGGGGVGGAYYFTKDISLLTGPVWFNDTTINGQWKWSTQLDINF